MLGISEKETLVRNWWKYVVYGMRYLPKCVIPMIMKLDMLVHFH